MIVQVLCLHIHTYVCLYKLLTLLLLINIDEAECRRQQKESIIDMAQWCESYLLLTSCWLSTMEVNEIQNEKLKIQMK